MVEWTICLLGGFFGMWCVLDGWNMDKAIVFCAGLFILIFSFGVSVDYIGVIK